MTCHNLEERVTAPSDTELFSITAPLVDWTDRTVVIQTPGGCFREVYIAGVDVARNSDGTVTLDKPLARARDEGIAQ
jgi:hypothetical protein